MKSKQNRSKIDLAACIAWLSLLFVVTHHLETNGPTRCLWWPEEKKEKKKERTPVGHAENDDENQQQKQPARVLGLKKKQSNNLLGFGRVVH